MKNWQQLLLSINMRWWQFRDALSTLFTHQKPLLAGSQSIPIAPPVPPARLRVRIGDPDPENYLTTGSRVSKRLRQHLGKYRELNDFERILDWGCGCGRVSRHMLTYVDPEIFFGCDVDPDAIAWMQETFSASNFVRIEPAPPTIFDDGFFDLVYGISIFTHLEESMQFSWLEELKRITRPGGLIAVTVHGDTGTDPSLKDRLEEKGFSDREGDRSIFFRHFLKDGYYRLTKHNKEYVMREWSKYFEILEFIEKGVGRQDLVIMRHTVE